MPPLCQPFVSRILFFLRMVFDLSPAPVPAPPQPAHRLSHHAAVSDLIGSVKPRPHGGGLRHPVNFFPRENLRNLPPLLFFFSALAGRRGPESTWPIPGRFFSSLIVPILLCTFCIFLSNVAQSSARRPRAVVWVDSFSPSFASR